MEIVEFGHMTPGQRDELQGDEDDPFGGAGITLEFQRKVNAAYRSQRLARTVVNAAITKAATFGPRFMLLFCHPDRAGLYDRLGFNAVEPPVNIGQRDGYAKMPMQTMWRALADGATWPSGHLTVRGLPF